MLIWDDEVTLPWTEEEQEMLAAMGPDERRLLGALPPGVHLRPYPGATNSMLMLWEYAHLHQTGSIRRRRPVQWDGLPDMQRESLPGAGADACPNTQGSIDAAGNSPSRSSAPISLGCACRGGACCRARRILHQQPALPIAGGAPVFSRPPETGRKGTCEPPPGAPSPQGRRPRWHQWWREQY